MGKIVITSEMPRRSARTRDNQARTQDSTLAYYVNQLDNFDQRLHQPLFNVSWGRDIKLRTGITMANESTSFTRSSFAGPGTQEAQGKPWLSATSNAIVGVDVNGERVVQPLRLLGREISYTSVELERSQLLGTSIDTAKIDAMNNLYQMETDEQVYIGDTFTGDKGLLNSAQVATGNVVGGAWAVATADVILTQVNEILTAAWAATGYSICPSELRIPPVQFGLITSKLVSSAGSISIAKYVAENCIANAINGKPLNIQPLKWLTGRGAGATDRMVAYTNAEDRVRFPMVPVRRETPYYQGIRFIAPYIWAYGAVEFVYPETVLYRDGI
jgi:hypothetical protein